LTNFWFNGTAIHRDCVVCRLPRDANVQCKTFRAIVDMPHAMDLWQRWQMILNDPSEDDPHKRKHNALKFYRKHEDAMDKGAKVLWPSVENLYELMSKRATIGVRAFEAEKQGNPVDPSMCDWDASLFEGEDVWFDKWPKGLEVLTIGADPSKGKGDKPSDFQALVAVGLKGDTLYVDAKLFRRGMMEMANELVDWIAQVRPDCAVIEADQFQELFLPVLDHIAESKGLLAPIEGIETEGVRKEVRIRRLGSYIVRRRVKFKRRSPGVGLLMEHLQDFPNGAHDDGPDAMEMALRKIYDLLGEAQASKIRNPQ
jgi:predicted phage terminase large subunit-like protein